MSKLTEQFANFKDYSNNILSYVDGFPNLTLDSKYVHILENTPAVTRDFLVYAYNKDMLCIKEGNTLNYAKNTMYSRLHQIHVDYLRYILDSCLATPKLSKNKYVSRTVFKFSKASIDLIKSLPFDYLSSFIKGYNDKTTMLRKFSLNQWNSQKNTLPVKYWEFVLRKEFFDSDDLLGSNARNLVYVIHETIKSLRKSNPDLTLIPCEDINTLAVQIYFKLKKQEPPEYIYQLSKSFEMVDCMHYNQMINLDEVKQHSILHPLLDGISSSYVTDFPFEILHYSKYKTNLNYSNAKIFQILIRYFDMNIDEFRPLDSWEEEIFPGMLAQRYMFDILTSPISPIFEDDNFSNIIREYASVSSTYDSLGNSKSVNITKSRRIFTPSQLNQFLSNSIPIQNRILNLLDTNADQKEIVKTLKIFYKMIYYFYCKLHGLDPSEPYTLKSEIKTYNLSNALDKKLTDTLNQVDIYTPDEDISKLSTVERKLNSILNHYVDLEYPTDFLNDLFLGSGKPEVLKETYASYLAQLLQPKIDSLFYENSGDDIATINYIREYVINSIPYHYIRLACLTIFDKKPGIFTTSRTNLLNYIQTSPSNIAMLEFISLLATQD